MKILNKIIDFFMKNSMGRNLCLKKFLGLVLTKDGELDLKSKESKQGMGGGDGAS